MYKNYLYLLRSISELRDLIQNQKIYEIYTQEKDKLFISIPLKNYDDFHIVISVNPQSPFLIIKNEHHKAKKNVLNFFENYLPDEINKIEIAFGDRIIKLTLSKCSLFYCIRGPMTNVYLIDNENNLASFKKIEEEEKSKIYDELLVNRYIEHPEKLYENITDKSDEEILNSFKFIDKSITSQLSIRKNIKLIDIFNEILNDDIRISISQNEGTVRFEPSSFYLPDNYTIINYHKKYFDALSEYFVQLNKLKKRKQIYSEIKKYLETELEKVSNKINNLKAVLEKESKENHYLKIGNLLLMNIYQLKKGMKEIELVDEENNKVKIALDEKLSPHQNIDEYFAKARAEKIQYEKSKTLYNELINHYNNLTRMKLMLENNLTDDELVNIKKELKIKESSLKKSNENSKPNFRHFIIDKKYHVYVGKDSHNNDELTLKFAKQNDYWFHARAVKGSHAILRVENTKESIPKKIIEKAASIAAFYSKAKTSKLAPVSYTLKKYVVKRKGMEPGEVALLKEEVVLVKPEIPAGSELVTE